MSPEERVSGSAVLSDGCFCGCGCGEGSGCVQLCGDAALLQWAQVLPVSFSLFYSGEAKRIAHLFCSCACSLLLL